LPEIAQVFVHIENKCESIEESVTNRFYWREVGPYTGYENYAKTRQQQFHFLPVYLSARRNIFPGLQGERTATVLLKVKAINLKHRKIRQNIIADQCVHVQGINEEPERTTGTIDREE